NIPDFTRFGRGQKEQMLGQTLGLPTTMIAFSTMGVIITSASMAILAGVPEEQLWKPDVLLSFLTSAQAAPGLTEPLIASGAGCTAATAVSTGSRSWRWLRASLRTSSASSTSRA